MTRIALLAGLLAAVACGGDESDPGYEITDTSLSFETGEYEVAPGDAFE